MIICYIDALSYVFQNFSSIWGIFWWCWWRFKSSGMLSSVNWYIVSQHFGGMWFLWLHRVKQSKYYWFYWTLKMGSLHSSESSLSVYQFTFCETSHNIWILFIFILIFWIDYRSVILKTYYYIDTSQFEEKNIKYSSSSMCINYLHLVFLLYIHGGKLWTGSLFLLLNL